MNRICGILRYFFFAFAFIFIFTFSNILKQGPNDAHPVDLLNFTVPHPPLWTSYIPIIGGFIGVVFEFFSIHGLVGLLVFLTLMYVSGVFGVLKDKIEAQTKESGNQHVGQTINRMKMTNKEFKKFSEEQTQKTLNSLNHNMIKNYGTEEQKRRLLEEEASNA